MIRTSWINGGSYREDDRSERLKMAEEELVIRLEDVERWYLYASNEHFVHGMISIK